MTEFYDPNWQPTEPEPPRPDLEPAAPVQQYFGPHPTQPWPPYGQPGYPPPAYPGYPGYGPPPPPPGPRRRRTGLIVVVIVAALAVTGVGVAAVLMIPRTSGRTVAAPAPTVANPVPTIPLTAVPPFSVPGGPGATVSPDQQAIVLNATRFMHALGAEQPDVFCPLWDPTDLRQVLVQNQISTCAHVVLRSETGRITDTAFRVTDPTAVQVEGSDAVIPNEVIRPFGFPGDVVMRKDSGDGVWKVVFTEE